MIANDIILPLRSKLRDQGDPKKPYYWTDGELLDYVDSAFQDIATRLEMYSKTVVLTRNDDIFMLPKDFSGILCVYIDGKECEQKSYSWVSQNRNKLNSYDGHIAYLNYDGIRLHPVPDAKSQIELAYSYTKDITSIDTEIELPSICKNLILFNCLFLANQKETEGKGLSLKKSEYYRGLYESELTKLKETVFNYKNSKNIKTRYKKV